MGWLTLLMVCAILSTARSQVTLGAGASTETVVEKTDSVFNVECSIASDVASDTLVVLEFDATSTAEEGYDIPSISGYTCTIVAFSTTGTVDIPILDDLVIDDGETVALTATSANTFTFTINDNADDVKKVVATPRSTVYWANEADGKVDIWFDFLDEKGNAVPLEEDFTIIVGTPSSGSDTAKVDEDFIIGTPPFEWLRSTGGVATLSASIQVTLIDDDTAENLENIQFQCSDDGSADSVEVSSTVEVQIGDNDKPEFIVMSKVNSLPRRSKKDVFFWAFVNYPATISKAIDFTTIPHNLKTKDRAYTRETVNSLNVQQLRISRPKKNSKARFNEYTFKTTQSIGSWDYVQTAYAYLTPSGRGKLPPIRIGTSNILTVFPDGVLCTALDSTNTITVSTSVPISKLRWDFVREGQRKRKGMRENNGINHLSLSTCDVAGLYIVYPKDKKSKGWEAYIRVRVSACPKEASGPDCSDEVICYNGGLVDPVSGLCSCPPGFAGQICEIVLGAGRFGSNGEYDLTDFPGDNRRGKGVILSVHGPIGVTCFTGYEGDDCSKTCSRGWFGANCAQTCHCAFGICNAYTGACKSECAAGYFGASCQEQ